MKLLSCMDAYFDYNQIKMYEPDMEKTSVVIDRVTYCYKVMPFRLKNVGATYYRLNVRIFKENIRKTMDVRR